MLGINQDGNNWKYVLANFGIVFAMTCLAELGLKTATGRFPTPFELYECIIKGLGSAFGSAALMLGINKKTGQTENGQE